MGRWWMILVLALAGCPEDGVIPNDDDVADDDDAADDDDVADDDDAADDDDSATGDDDDSATGDDDDSATGDGDDSATGDDDDSATTVLVDADGDGWPIPHDCDDTDPLVNPGVLPTAAVADPGLSWFWNGQPVLVAAVPATFGPVGCGIVGATTDLSFLSATVDPNGWVTVLLDGSSAVGGVHTATVSIVDTTTGAVLADFPVDVTALGSATGAPVRRALVVGLDGVRGDSVDPASTPNLDLLRSHAMWTDEASTQLQAATSSGPGWTSILTGVDADKHLITSNGNYGNRDLAYPSFLWRLRDAGFSTAAWTSWDPIFDSIMEADATDDGGVGDDASVTADLADSLLLDDHDASFIHIDNIDGAGHSTGFTPVNPTYLSAIATADAQIGDLLDAILARPTIASEEWMVVVSTDHGGIGNSHGCLTWECRDIPLLVAGPSVNTAPAPGFVSHLDVAPTVLDFLGLPPEPAWDLDGEVVGDFFELDCEDGVDGDGDGDIDCDDSDCDGAFLCSCPATDAGQAEGFSLATGHTSGDTDDDTGSCGGGGAPDTTVLWTAPSTDTWTFDLTASDRNFDTILYARDACGGTELACNDDASSLQSAITVPLTAGDSVVLVVDGEGGDSGPWTLNAEGLSSCPDADAGSLIGSAVASGSNLAQGATFFASCARSGRDALVRWTAPSDATFVFDTSGSDYDTVISVRDGDCSGPELSCNDDGLPSYLSTTSVALTTGQVVTVVISGFNGRPEAPGSVPNNGGGNWVLNVSQ